ncbi:hypothetical protein CXB51_019230 [Gossypium anomalum]|uniref:Retrotransposon Copia-like N-terminal domain-containing protein n=1 Tax=Gossypium anomalum TaxID=47600 RepID=A0A8J5YSY6_9ROSI|nr:hypothetical protein CXB51_019230 [Gossypium anomalum]
MESFVGSADVVVEESFNPFAFAMQKVAMLVDDSNFLAWKQHVLLVLKTHCLLPFVEGTITMPPQSIASEDGALVENSAYARHHVSLEEHQPTILNGLLSKFDHVVSIIMTNCVPFDMHEITSALLDAEARQQAHVSHFSANIAETGNRVSPMVASDLSTYSRKSHMSLIVIVGVMSQRIALNNKSISSKARYLLKKQAEI